MRKASVKTDGVAAYIQTGQLLTEVNSVAGSPVRSVYHGLINIYV
jgi:hypothetical protein